MAVLILYFHKLNPFSSKKTQPEKKSTWRLWAWWSSGAFRRHHRLSARRLLQRAFLQRVDGGGGAYRLRRDLHLARTPQQKAHARLPRGEPPRGRHARAAELDGEEALAEAEAALYKGADGRRHRLEDGAQDRMLPNARHRPRHFALRLHHHRRHAVRVHAHSCGGSSRSSWRFPSCSAGVF